MGESDSREPLRGASAGTTRNRKWLLILALTPMMVVVVTFAVYLWGPSEPTVALSPPPGYQTIADAYFAYAIPNSWHQDASGTDNNGDFFYRGTTGWVGETLVIRRTPPTLLEPAPLSLTGFGQSRPAPYQLVGGRSAEVSGTDRAYSYELERTGQPPLAVVDAWVRSTSTEIWLVVDAGATQASTITSSLRA